MRYVLDSSVALKWLLPEPDSDKATQLREDARNAVHELLAPDIFPTEILNSLTKAERTRRLNVCPPRSSSLGLRLSVDHGKRSGLLLQRLRASPCLSLFNANRSIVARAV